MCFTTRPVEYFEVLNDLVIDRGPSPYVSMLELFGDEHHMTTVQGDGLTISTPTGSTAYSLSAGGSLVHPEIPAILITPIAPHTLSFRPMLLPDSMEVRICVPFNSRSTAWASFDGRGRVELKQGDHIKVTASKYPFPTVCADKQSTDWFHAISRTLKWNERERQKSFVVVEEGPAKEERKNRQRKHHPESTASASKGHDDEEDEDNSDEEEEKFDIDDLSSDTSDAAAPTAGSSRESSFASSPGVSPLSGAASRAAEAIMGLSPAAHERARAESRSRSGVQSGVDSPSRFAPVPVLPGDHGHGHVQWATSVPSSAGDRSSRAEGGTADVPTPKTALPTRRGRSRSRSPVAPTVHSHQHPRAFAVWGQDESDSNSSDNDP